MKRKAVRAKAPNSQYLVHLMLRVFRRLVVRS